MDKFLLNLLMMIIDIKQTFPNLLFDLRPHLILSCSLEVVYKKSPPLPTLAGTLVFAYFTCDLNKCFQLLSFSFYLYELNLNFLRLWFHSKLKTPLI